MRLSRRPAREAALEALYEIEVGKSDPVEALNERLMFRQMATELEAYAERLVRGVLDERETLDGLIGPLLHRFDLDRLAAVDRNVLRLAAWEIYRAPEIPPAVTINEAVEIAKRFSTAESGKFVNGVLGRLLSGSPKADWRPEDAPPEEREAPAPPVEEEPIVEETVEAGTEEAKVAKRFGWTLRGGDREIPPVSYEG